MFWRGEWQSGTSYDVDDVVSYAGSSYIATLATDGSQSPSNGSFWELVAENGSGSVVYRAVGFSSAQVFGNAGILGMHSACQSDYGPSARLATSEEVFLTPSLTSQSGSGWAQGVPTPGRNYTDQILGESNQNTTIACNGWSSTSGNGVIYEGLDYSIGSAACNISRSAVCALPTNENKRYNFSGFSSASVLGSAGFLGMHGACQIDFGSNARMATEVEVFNTAELTAQTGSAWVRPVFTSGSSLGGTIRRSISNYPNSNCDG